MTAIVVFDERLRDFPSKLGTKLKHSFLNVLLKVIFGAKIQKHDMKIDLEYSSVIDVTDRNA